MRKINLLSKDKQRDLAYEAITRNIAGLWWVLFVAVIITVAGSLVTRFLLQKKRTDLIQKISEIQQVTNRKENSELKAQIKAVNDSMHDYLKLADKTPKWSNVIAAIIIDLPQDVKISSLTTDPKKLTMTISGTSKLREDVIQLYNNIKNDSEHFENIDYPLENVSKPTDAAFHFTFNIKKQALE